ncbi:rod shape-determining protein MreC [soil metagenome]
MSSFTIRHRIAIVIVLAVACIGMLALDSQGLLDPVRTGLRQGLSPIESLSDSIVRDGKSDSELQRENDALKAERDALAAEVARLRQFETEAEQLREQLKVQDSNPDWQLVTARVSFPDPNNLNKFITIDKGTADGIQKGMAVVDPNFFVGLVTEVSEHSAKITLAIDMTAVVAAQDQDTGAAGNAYGMWQENGRIQLRHVDRNSTLKNGDPIATSSNATVSSAYVPGGILIGQVDGDPVLDNQGDTQTVNIIPFTDFDNLEVVSVIVAYDPATDVPLTPEPAATPVAGQ